MQTSAPTRARAAGDYATADRVRGNWLRDDIRRYWNARPPSLDTIWWQHGQAARWFEAGMFRRPRYLWGCLHTGISALGYALAWTTRTVPGAVTVAGLICLPSGGRSELRLPRHAERSQANAEPVDG